MNDEKRARPRMALGIDLVQERDQARFTLICPPVTH